MGKRYLKILKTSAVHSEHSKSSSIIETLIPQQMISYNREKRRDGINWMEIYLPGNKVGYIEKKSDSLFICSLVELADESVQGFGFTQKGNGSLPMNMLFGPTGHYSSQHQNVGRVKLESVENAAENKIIRGSLEYLPDQVDVEIFEFKKDEQFYLTYNTYDRKDLLVEVDNLKGKRGFILKKSNYAELGDKWMLYLAVVVGILTVIAIFLTFLENGMIVISGLMILAGLVVAVVFIVVMQILLMILQGIFNQIRKRF